MTPIIQDPRAMKTTTALLLLSALLLAAPLSRAQTSSAPTLVSATASFYYVPDIYLSWHGDNSVGAVAYRIYRSLGDSLHFELVGTSYYATYGDFQILGGQVYYYYVTSNVFVDTTRYESARSSYVSAIAVQQGGGGGGGGSKRKNNGTIAGRVTDSLSGKAISAAQVTFYRVSSAGVPVQKLLTDGSGHYRAALDTGTYVIKAQPPLSGGSSKYRPEWYKDASEASQAERIHVDDSSRIVADVDLSNPGALSPLAVNGTVMDSAGSPLQGARVAIMRSIQDMEEKASSGDDVSGVDPESIEIEDVGHVQGVVWQGIADSLGHFQGAVAASESYIVLAVKRGYAPQFFYHQSSPTMANPLRLTHDTSGIDFNLRAVSPAGAYNVMGMVSDSSGARVPSRIALIPVRRQSDDSPACFACTDTTGAFTVAHVPAGTYIALALPFSLYAPAYHKAEVFGASRWQQADTIVVGGDVTGIDIGVARITVGGISGVSGRITSGGAPARGVNVYATFANGSIAGYGLTDNTGFYSLNGLPAEELTLWADLEGFQTTQTTVTIAPGHFSTSGVDLVLSPAVVSSVPEPGGIANSFALDQNYPNPFNPKTGVRFEVPGVSDVKLSVYDILGREVAVLVNERKAAGTYEVNFDGNNLASGVYFYRLAATPVSGGTKFQSIKKMLLMK